MSEVVGTAVVEVRADTKGVDTQIRRGFDKAGKDAGRVFSGSFKRNIATVGAGVLAAGGIVGISRSLISLGRDSIKAASEQSAANALVARSIKNVNAESTIFGKTIEETLEAESRITGIADDELAPAFTRLVQVTKDSAEAFNLLQLAEDISRQRKIGVAQAALTLAKAQGGQLSALRRIIPGLKEESAELSKQENIRRALGQVQRQFGGARTAFAESDAGQLQRFNVAVDELKETLGAELLPVLSRAAKSIADTFSKPETQEKIKTTGDTIKSFIGGAVDVVRAGAEGIGDRLEFRAAVAGAENIGRLATAIQTLDERMKGLTKSEQERTRELVKFQQINEAEAARFQGARELAQEQPGRGPQGLETVTPARSTIDPGLSARIREAEALATETTADDISFFTSRKKNIDEQIAVLNRGLRGKNDQQRLLRLLDEQNRLSDGINEIEQAASDARADAAEERKRIAEEERDRIKAEREEAALKAKEEREAAAQEARDSKERQRSLKESRLQLRLQKAELSGNEAQQKSALRATIRFYGEQAKGFRRTNAQLRAVEAESNKVATQQRLRDLKGKRNESTSGGARTDFFQEAANQFRTFGSNIGRAGDPLSGQDARGQFAGFALDRRRNTANLEQDSLNEQQSQTSVLREIRDRLRVTTRAAEGNQPPNRRSPTATDIARVNARNQLAGR